MTNLVEVFSKSSRISSLSLSFFAKQELLSLKCGDFSFVKMTNFREILSKSSRIPLWCSFATSTYLHYKRNHSISSAVHIVIKITALNWGIKVRSDSFRITNGVAFDCEFFVKPDRSDIPTIFRTELFSVLCEVSWLRTIFYSRILSDTLMKSLLVWLLCSSKWRRL
jgi:hypothetical protein